MIFDLIKTNRTLRELMYGILAFGIICEGLLLIFTKQRAYNSIGLIAGIIISLICAVHMAWGIDIAVNLDEKSSIAFTRKYTVIRYLIMCVILALIGITDFGSPVTLILGYMGLKAGAYMNPLIHKLGGPDVIYGVPEDEISNNTESDITENINNNISVNEGDNK